MNFSSRSYVSGISMATLWILLNAVYRRPRQNGYRTLINIKMAVTTDCFDHEYKPCNEDTNVQYIAKYAMEAGNKNGSDTEIVLWIFSFLLSSVAVRLLDRANWPGTLRKRLSWTYKVVQSFTKKSVKWIIKSPDKLKKNPTTCLKTLQSTTNKRESCRWQKWWVRFLRHNTTRT